MIFYFLIGLFAFLLMVMAWVIFIPISLYVDTDNHRYELNQTGVFEGRLSIENGIQFQINILGIRIDTSSAKNKSVGADKPKPKEVKRKSKLKRSASAWWSLTKGMINCFSIKKLIIDIDTDDVILNSALVPLLILSNHGVISITTNYNRRVYAHLELDAYLYKILWVFLRFLTSKNKNYGNEF